MSAFVPLSAGVIGWPVAHSKSPLIHRFWLGKLGLDGDYGRFLVHPDLLELAVRAMPALGIRGANITLPHKVAVMAFLDHVDDSARVVGAVNTVKVLEGGRLGGVNTDIEGVLEPTRDLGLAGAEVIIAGTGGAARAALAAAVIARAGWVTILARDEDKAVHLLRSAGQQGTVLPIGGPLPESPDTVLFFNATTLGMAGQPALPVDLGVLPPGATVFDAVYAPLETPLLAAARERGLATIDGLQMLVGQARQAFEILFGQPAPREHDAELRALLAR